jgi:hypothetical protein
MAVSSLDQDTVRLLPGVLRMEEDRDMTLYYMAAWALEDRYRNGTKEGVRMWIKIQRKPMNELLTTYLPAILLLMITYSTTLFKPYFFEAALSVNLTNMLVMTTIFIGVMQSLPTTAYVKMVDVWLIGCQLVPFVEVVLLTAMEYFREGDGSGRETEEKRPTSVQTTSEQGNKTKGTRTINHHGAPRVVVLSHYEAEGGAPQQAATPALATVEEGPASPVSSTSLPTQVQGKSDREKKKRHLERIKCFGMYLNVFCS